MHRHAGTNGRHVLSPDMHQPASRLSSHRYHTEMDCSSQLQLLEELQDDRLKRRKFLQAQVEQNLVAEADIVELASRKRQQQDEGEISPQQELLSLRETNKALRYKIREKQRLVQSLLKQQQQPGEKSELQAMIARNKQYLEEIKRRNQEFKRQLEGMYTSDPRREALKFGQLKSRLLDFEQQIDEYQREQLRLRQKIDEQRSQNSQLSIQNQQFKQVLEEYSGELEKCKSQHQSGSDFEERLTFLLTENTQIGLKMDQLENENVRLKEQLVKSQHMTKQKEKDQLKKEKECQQLKQLLKEVRQQYNATLAEQETLSGQLEKEQQQRVLAQEEIANLNVQIKSLQDLRQLQLEQANELKSEVKQQEHLKSKTEVLSLKSEYDSTIKKLTEQNEQLMKQLQLVFEMKNRNEEELLKTLRLHEKLQKENAVLEEKVKSVTQKQPQDEAVNEKMAELRQRLDQAKLQNVKLLNERESLLKELRGWEERWSRKLTDQSSNQKNISVIERDYSSEEQQDATSNNELQFLKDELESGNRNMHMLKQQIELSEYNIKLKSNEVRDLQRRTQRVEQQLQQEREMRKNLQEKYRQCREASRTKEDEIEQLLNKNAKQNQRFFQLNQKCNTLQLKLQEEAAIRSHLAEEHQKQLADIKREAAQGMEKQLQLKIHQEMSVLKQENLKLSEEKAEIQSRLLDMGGQLDAVSLEMEALKSGAIQERRQLQSELSSLVDRLLKDRKGSVQSASIHIKLELAVELAEEESRKSAVEIERLKQVSDELLNEIGVKDKEVEFLVGQNTELKVQAERALSQIKQDARLIELQQECTVRVLVERVEKSSAEAEELRQRLDEYEREIENIGERSKRAKEQPVGKKQLPPVHIPNNSKENQPSKQMHDYLIMLKDLKQYMQLNKLQIEQDSAGQLIDEGLPIIKSAKEHIRTLLSQNFLLREGKRKLEKELESRCDQAEADEQLLSGIESEKLHANCQLQLEELREDLESLREELSRKETEHTQGIGKLQEFIVSRESEFAKKISELESQLAQAKAQPGRNTQQQSNIAWSDLRDSENLEYSYSTVPRDSVGSNLLVDNLQNLEDRNEERIQFQSELREVIGKYLSLDTNRLGQLILSAYSNLFLYPSHDQLLQFLEQFVQAVKYYEEYQCQKMLGMRSTIMEYCGKAQELLEDGDVNLLSGYYENPPSQLSQKKTESVLRSNSNLNPLSRRVSNSSSGSNDKRSKSKSSERKKPGK